MDFLSKHRALITCADLNIRLTRNPNPLTVDLSQSGSNMGNSPQMSEIIASRETVIPPFQTRLIKAKTSLINDILITPTKFLSPEAVFSVTNGVIFVPITNNDVEPLTISRKTVISTAETFLEEQIVTIDSINSKKPLHNPITKEQREYIDQHLTADLTDSKLQKLKQLLYRFHDIISFDKHDLGLATAVKHKIDLKTKEPIHLKQYRIPEAHLKFLNEQVTAMLQTFAIRPSSSAYNSPVFCVKKPHSNDLRLVQDFRALNLNTYDLKYAIKEIQECLDSVGRRQSKIFSSIDLRSGFWQQSMDDKSAPYTAFSVPGRGRFEWTRMPMGLKGSPASFQRLMDHVFQDLPCAQSYLDDILCHSQDFFTHISHLEQTFLRLRQHGLKMNLDKCKLFAKSVTYLGHTLTPDGVTPSIDNIKAVRDFPEPTTIRQIREWCGLCNYFRPHIHQFAKLAGQMTALLRKDSQYKAGKLPPIAQAAFLALKEQLCSAPLLAYPLPNTPYILATDASVGTPDVPGGLGAILSQIHPDGMERVIAYASASLNTAQKNYSPFLLEMAAANYGIEHFSVYLLGRKFTLFTDHKPLEKMSLIHKRTLNRLQENMLQYDFDIKYRSGPLNSGPDALSRNPVDSVNIGHLTDIVKIQKQDSFLKYLRNYLQQKILPKEDEFRQRILHFAKDSFIKNDILYYILLRKNVPPAKVILVPKIAQLKLIAAFHSSPFEGHMGAIKTVLKLQQFYFWEKMLPQTVTFVDSCPVCLQVRNPRKLSAPLKSLPIVTKPNERIHLDLLGPLKNSISGDPYLLVITDAFTKYAQAITIPNKEARTVATQFYIKHICVFSPPSQILSDRGREFDCAILNDLTTLFKIEKRMTSSYHAQSNTQAESYNRTFIKLMKATLENSTLDWESALPAVTFAYNTHVHKSTLQSPFFLTFLHHPNLPHFDLDRPDVPSTDYATKAYFQMEDAFITAEQQLKEAALDSKRLYDRKTKLRKFFVNDQVLIRFPKQLLAQKEKPHGNPKFTKEWVAGYFIAKVISPVVFHVKKTPQSKPIVVNIDRVKLNTHFPQVQGDILLPEAPQTRARTKAAGRVDAVYHPFQTRQDVFTYEVEFQAPQLIEHNEAWTTPNRPFFLDLYNNSQISTHTLTSSLQSVEMDDSNRESPPLPSDEGDLFYSPAPKTNPSSLLSFSSHQHVDPMTLGAFSTDKPEPEPEVSENYPDQIRRLEEQLTFLTQEVQNSTVKNQKVSIRRKLENLRFLANLQQDVSNFNNYRESNLISPTTHKLVNQAAEEATRKAAATDSAIALQMIQSEFHSSIKRLLDEEDALAIKKEKDELFSDSDSFSPSDSDPEYIPPVSALERASSDSNSHQSTSTTLLRELPTRKTIIPGPHLEPSTTSRKPTLLDKFFTKTLKLPTPPPKNQ